MVCSVSVCLVVVESYFLHSIPVLVTDFEEPFYGL